MNFILNALDTFLDILDIFINIKFFKSERLFEIKNDNPFWGSNVKRFV